MITVSTVQPSQRSLLRLGRRDSSLKKTKFIQQWYRRWAGRNIPDAKVVAEIAWYIHCLDEQHRSKTMRASGPVVPWQGVDVTLDCKTMFFKALNIPVPSDYDLVFQPKPNPLAFDNAESFRNAYWSAESWSKFPFDLEGVDRQAAAEAAFYGFERQCAVANERLHDVFTKPVPEWIHSALGTARQKLAWLFRSVSLDDWIPLCTFSGGASTGLSRVNATVQNKSWLAFCGQRGAGATPRVVPYVHAWGEWSKFDVRPLVVYGNQLDWVDKNAKTKRTIAKEPEWNMFFQLGLGKMIRRQLQRCVGLLLPDAQQRQQERARLGSISGDLATLDLKGASDTICMSLGEVLLPSHVWKWICDLRSPTGSVGDEIVTYEKISSMGNGFTFELETALFWAICSSIDPCATAYGDDIVVSTSSALAVWELLEFCGFQVNLDKSFVVGDFRESCGEHYFRGVRVTPPYFKKPLIYEQRIQAANSLRRCATDGLSAEAVFKPTWDLLIAGFPKQFWGPTSMGGQVIHVESIEIQKTFFSRGLSQRFWKGKGIKLVADECVAPGLGAARWNLFGSRDHGLVAQRQLVTKPDRNLANGYVTSKFRSDLLIGQARDYGLALVSQERQAHEDELMSYATDGFSPKIVSWKQPTTAENTAVAWL